MNHFVMGNLDGDLERVAFRMEDIKQIIDRNSADLVFSGDQSGLFLKIDGQVSPVEGPVDKENIKPFFIVLNSGIALNTIDYQILFNVKELPNHLLTGIDASGREHFCQRYSPVIIGTKSSEERLIQEIDEKIQTANLEKEDIEILKDMIHKLREGEFFELLTMDFSGKIKEVAKELIDFRKDIQEKIEPEIIELASRDIPEASNQLEGINDTLEESTMRIIDINEDQIDTANKQLKTLELFIKGNGHPGEMHENVTLDDALNIIEKQISILREIGDRALKMVEPLNFQDLVGQRIQKIIKLVRSMEVRIEELIVSFGIRLQKHKEDPTRTFEDLTQDVEAFMTDLKGPQRVGEGLDQAGIDNLLANL